MFFEKNFLFLKPTFREHWKPIKKRRPERLASRRKILRFNDGDAANETNEVW